MDGWEVARVGDLPINEERPGIHLLENYKLQPLTDDERKFAADNHNLIYGFLHRYGYSLENYYDIAIFGFLKAVQIYRRREDLRNKYTFPFISWKYMRAEIGNHSRMEAAKKRKPSGTVVSLDAGYCGTENFYNCLCNADERYPESEVLEMEQMAELVKDLSDAQQKIIRMRIAGYKNKEIYTVLGIKQSTFYLEMRKIRRTVYQGKLLDA